MSDAKDINEVVKKSLEEYYSITVYLFPPAQGLRTKILAHFHNMLDLPLTY